MMRTAKILTSLLCALSIPMRSWSDEVKPGSPPAAQSASPLRPRAGPWSEPETWEGGAHPRVRGRGSRYRAGHTVSYDVASDQTVRSIHVAGTLRFDPDRDTRLNVGLIKIQAGEDASENGFDCDAHAVQADAIGPRPALEVGTAGQPIAAGHSAIIRLVTQPGMDPETCPAIVCCGGRMDLHGACSVEPG